MKVQVEVFDPSIGIEQFEYWFGSTRDDPRAELIIALWSASLAATETDASRKALAPLKLYFGSAGERAANRGPTKG
jgi:hypothetical protein